MPHVCSEEELRSRGLGMDLSWLQELLKLLFGQVGVLGTVLIGFAAYIGWLLEQEKREHERTRTRAEEVYEKRTILFETYLKAMTELRVAVEASATTNRIAIDALTTAINSRKRTG